MRRRKVKACRFSSGNWFFCSCKCAHQFAEVRKKKGAALKACAPAKEECNKYD
jgi:hypothetical protein